MALLDFLVVGISGVNLSWRQFAVAAYVDMLMDDAFGNFRTLLTNISTNAAMGSFLTFLGNRRANAADRRGAGRELRPRADAALHHRPAAPQRGRHASRPAPAASRSRPIPRTTSPASPASSPAGTSIPPTTTRPTATAWPMVNTASQHETGREDLPRHDHPGRHRRAEQPAPRARRDLRPSQCRAVRLEAADPASRHLEPGAGLCRADLGGVRE